MHYSTQKIYGLLVIFLLGCGLPATAFAQKSSSFDAGRYFKRLDRNGDERLDENELNPKATIYLRRLGVDVDDDRIKLRDINKMIEKGNESSQAQLEQQAQLAPGLKVPAFGVPMDESTVNGFGNGDPSGAVEFSESTVEMTESVLRRYDRNKDNVIDDEERKRGRWGRPDPKESDLNKDGVLTRNELLQRYHVRQQEQSRERGDSRDGNRKGGDDSSDGRRGRGSDRDRDGGDRDRAKTSTRSSTTATNRTGGRSSQQDREAYEKYSKSLIKRYDKDNDQRLSKEEWKSVRRPPENADHNKDGFVSQREYANALFAAAESKKGSTKSASPKPSSGNSDGGRIVKRSSNSKGKKSVSKDMTKLDKNADAQVQMHEYSKDWDEKKLDEFYKIDKNRDGVITASEWKSK